MNDDAIHPPGCECGQHAFVEPAALLLQRWEREVARMTASLSPAEQRILAARMAQTPKR